MNRKYFYILCYIILTLLISIFGFAGEPINTVERIVGGMIFGLIALAVVGTIIDLIIVSIWPNALYSTFSAKRNVAVELIKDREKKQAHMLHIMQWGHTNGLNAALEEFNALFKKHPRYRLSKWIVFRSWYKHIVDDYIDCMAMKDGSPYSKEEDPMYDPTAPDWEIYDRDHSYDYVGDEDDDDDEDYSESIFDKEKRRKNEAMEALYFGMGMGIVDGLFGDPDGSHSCSDGGGCDCGGDG